MDSETKAVTLRDEFGAQQLQRSSEMAAQAVAARAKAQVEAAYVMAERHPRSWSLVRVDVLDHCKRPRFAEVAMYRKPVGKKFVNGQWQEQFAEGLSARFAESAMQAMGNLMPEAAVVHEDEVLRIVRATVTDLEKNVTMATEIPIQKTAERKGRKGKNGDWEPPEGREVLGKRPNSYGDTVFTVRATVDEITLRQASEVSKAWRNAILKLLPRDIAEDAIDQIQATLTDPKATDPQAGRKRVEDSFATIGVLPDDLAQYIGASLSRISPHQLAELRGLYSAIKDGEATFDAAMKAKYGNPAAPEDETSEQRDIRLQKQMAEQERVVREKMAAAGGNPDAVQMPKRGRPPKPPQAPTPPQDEATASYALIPEPQRKSYSEAARQSLRQLMGDEAGEDQYGDILKGHNFEHTWACYSQLKDTIQKLKEQEVKQ